MHTHTSYNHTHHKLTIPYDTRHTYHVFSHLTHTTPHTLFTPEVKKLWYFGNQYFVSRCICDYEYCDFYLAN